MVDGTSSTIALEPEEKKSKQKERRGEGVGGENPSCAARVFNI